MKTIKDFDLKNKKVIIRCDFNVPMKDGSITDDLRIVESLPTIKYALNEGAKVILMSHLGRVKEESDKANNSLKPVASRLKFLLDKDVLFINTTRGSELEDAVTNMKSGDLILVENTRFEDLDGKKESGNDLELGKYWASLADVFINDAFGTSHRAHASNVGIATNLPSGIGFLVEKEVNVMGEAINNPRRPFTVLLGGVKVSDKIGLIENLVSKADYILIGGAMAFTFLKSLKYNVGSSIVDDDSLDYCKNLMCKYKDKIILPIDVIKAKTEEDPGIECFITDIESDEKGYDIGYQTVELFTEYLSKSKTIIWNGPVGLSEIEAFSKGTKGICQTLKGIEAIKIAGGGDTAAAIAKFGFKEAFTHISTGGGASLEMLEGKDLPGISVIK